MVRVAPSVLASDFLRLGEEVAAVERGGADRLHLDVMDGRFVPNISFGIPVVQALRKATRLPLETHLMIVEPERWAEPFAKAGATTLIVHAEATPHLHRAVHQVKELGLKAGVALNPATPLGALDEMLEDLDLALVMTVNPGFGGQKFLEATLRKVSELRRRIDARNLPCELEVDGGVDERTAPRLVAAGATVLVAGTSVFGHRDGAEAGVRRLKQ